MTAKSCACKDRLKPVEKRGDGSCEIVPCRCRSNTATIPHEQWSSHTRLQRLKTSGHRGLRNGKLRGGVRDGTRTINRQKRPKQVEANHNYFYRNSEIIQFQTDPRWWHC